MLKTTTTSLDGVLVLQPTVFADSRGWFSEQFNHELFARCTGVKTDFIQDNHSHSHRNVLRGLHYQLHPSAQGKLVWVVRGTIFDVAVDIRRQSPHFGHWVGKKLSARNRLQLWIPPGFAHGFLTLSASASVHYKTTAYYDRERERCIAWDDPELGIEWPLNGNPPQLSEKDRNGKSLALAEVFS